MRAYVRHLAEFPIELLRADEAEQVQPESLHDIGAGGLSCFSHSPFEEGQPIRVRIPLGDPGFEAGGRVAWCRQEGDRYHVGVAFADEALAFSARMVEQVLHIEQYHRQLLEQGQNMTKQEAALDWISKHAAEFPR